MLVLVLKYARFSSYATLQTTFPNQSEMSKYQQAIAAVYRGRLLRGMKRNSIGYQVRRKASGLSHGGKLIGGFSMKNRIYELVGIAFGCFLTALGINALIVPGQLLTGGVTGVAILIHHFVPVPVSIMYLVLNIPLLIIGFFQIGRKFSLYTVYAAVLLTVFLALIRLHHFPTHDILLDSIFGGVLSGAGGGLALRLGGSQGGLDIVTRVIAKHKNVTVANLSLIFNAVIIVLSLFLFNIQIAMFTLISIYASSRTYSVLLNHIGRISVIIITEHGERVSRAITESMIRGVTSWEATGTYSNRAKNVLLCVTTNVQLTDLRTIVLKYDPQAFISVIQTQNVIGNFEQIW